jgi:hypothetical protein
MAVPDPNLLTEPAAREALRSRTYRAGTTPWVDLEEKLAGRDIRSKRTKEHRGGVSSRVVRTAVLGSWAVELEKTVVCRGKPRDSALTEIKGGNTMDGLYLPA